MNDFIGDKQCVTHHHACDCREAAHKEQIADLQAELDKYRWIPVSEGVPEETEWVLVHGDGAVACRAWRTETQEWADFQKCQWPGLDMDAITHWMPIPELPST